MTKLLKWLVKATFGLVILILLTLASALAYLHNGDMSKHQERISSFLSEKLQREVQFADGLDINFSKNLNLKTGSLSIENASWGTEAQMFELEKAELSISILPLISTSPKFVIEDLNISGLKLVLHPSQEKDGTRSNWAFDSSSKKEKSKKDSETPYLKLTKAKLKNISFVIYNLKGEPLRISIREGSIDETGEKLKLKLAGFYNKNKIDLVGQTVALNSLPTIKTLPFKLDITAETLNLKGEGEILLANPLKHTDLDLELKGQSLHSLEEIIGINLPKFKELDLKTNLNLANNGLSLKELDAKIGPSNAVGGFSYNWGAKPQLIKAKLESELIDIKSLSSAFKNPAENTTKKTKEATAKEEGFDLKQFLQNYTIDASLDIKSINASDKLKVSDVLTEIALKDSQLRISPFTAGFFDGIFTGSIEASSNEEETKAKAQLNTEQFNLGKCLNSLEIESGITCKANSMIELATTGETQTELIANLDGNILLNSEYGEITSNLLKVASVGLDEILGPLFKGSSDVQVDCLQLAMEVNKGVLKNTGTVIFTEVVTAFADGDIDLNELEADLDINLKTTNPSLASLVPPFTISGPFKDLSILPNITDTAVGIAKSGVGIVDSVAGTMKDSVESTANMIMDKKSEEVKGLALCKKALEKKNSWFPSTSN